MYYPDLETFKKKAAQGNLVPVYTELMADLETPVTAFLKLNDQPFSYLLESAETGRGIGRYSFLGGDPILVFRSRGAEVEIVERGGVRQLKAANPLMLLKGLLQNYRPVPDETLPPFNAGAVGYVGYDYVRRLERLPELKLDELNLPETCFMLTDSVVIFDRLLNKLILVANARVDGAPEKAYREAVDRLETLLGRLSVGSAGHYFQPPPPRPRRELASNFPPGAFPAAVKKAQEYIRAGDILQVVLSQRFTTRLSCPPFDVYRALRTVNPSPYMFYLRFEDLHLVGSSPEIMVQVTGDKVRVRPIAGTRPRGISLAEDKRLEADLLGDAKERAEHVMLVDLGRNDVGRVAVPGSVAVTDLMAVERYSHVMHLVSDVEGRLEPAADAFSALAATFPAGTVSGAPKIRAMEIIEELEPVRRGPYAGAVGYFSCSGHLDTCIAIRTVIVKGKTAVVQAGAGIVADSDPEREDRECRNKAQALFQAIEMAEGGLK